MKGLTKKTYIHNTKTQQCSDSQREREKGVIRVGRSGGNEDGKRLCLRKWAHDAVRDDVSLSCTLVTCMV